MLYGHDGRLPAGAVILKLIVFIRLMNRPHRAGVAMELEIRHLRMVAAVAASGSVTQAAANVHLTQSAVSHQLRDIEARLGTPLFLRVGKRMVPTAAGERVLATARRVLDDIVTAEADVRRLGTAGAGRLRVCAQCNTGYHWLPALVDAFRRRYPLVDVVIAVECTLQPIEALLDGRLDLAIVTQEIRNRQLRVRPLFEDEHAAIVAPDHPFASRAFVRAEDFAGERLLLYSGSTEDSFTFREILRPAGVKPERISFVMLTEAILEMVKARLGISVMQTWAVEPAIRSGEVRAIPITAAGIHRRWSAATLRAAPPSPAIDAFVDLLAARAMPARKRPLGLPSRRPRR
jgi:LysR family transcriptional regulator for metE and metH